MQKKLILQTSIEKPSERHVANLMRFAPDWEYKHFNDAEILEYFKNNPIPGFENIEDKFYSLRRGEHRADLFRYYYIYLEGGFFIDFDFKIVKDLNEVIQDYDFVCSEIKATDPSVLGSTKRARCFNGYMYAKKDNPIIFQALLHLYNIDVDNLGPANGVWDSRYHLVCEQLYNIVYTNINKTNIKLYVHSAADSGSLVTTQSGKILGKHANSVKAGKEYSAPKRLA